MHTVVATYEVVEAEVYRTGATVTGHGEAALVAGENRLVVGGLPVGVDEGSVILRMPASVSQGQVRVSRERVVTEEAEATERELTQRIDELDRQIANRQLELDAWKVLPQKLEGPSALDALALLPTKLDELTSELVRLRAERADLATQRDEQRARLDCPRLIAELSVPADATCPFELVCRTGGASWKPSYDVLAQSDGDKLGLRMRAEVWQRTGMDWQDVTLRLSTGTTSVLGALPRFFPRRLTTQAPEPLFGAYYADAAMEAPSPGAGARKLRRASSPSDTASFMESLADVAAPQALVAEQATAVTFELVGTQSLSGDGVSQTLTVATTELAARYYHYAFPRKQEAAYLVARLDREPDREVFERPVAVYLDGSYAGTVRMSHGDAGEEGFELALGRDDRVRVRRSEEVRSSKSLLGGKVTREHASNIVVENRRTEPVRLVVLEQVPVSRDKEIEVAVRETSGGTLDEERGELRWERELAAGESLTLRATYAVSHGRDVTVHECE